MVFSHVYMNRYRYFIIRLQLLTSISKTFFTFLLGRFNSVQLHLYITDFVNLKISLTAAT